MQRSKRHIFEDADWVLILLFLLLAIMGWINIYAASYNEEHQSIFDFSMNYGKQMIWIVASLVLASVIMLTDVRIYEQFGYVIYGITSFLLLLVLVAGTEIKGARSWFTIGGVLSLQPSEFAKFGTALAVSKYLSSLNVKITDLQSRLTTILLLAIPGVLITLQPDPGSTLVYVSFVFVMYREGMSGNVLLLGLITAVLFIVTLILKQTSVGIPFTDFEMNGKFMLVLTILIITGVAWFVMKSYNKKIWSTLLIGAIVSIGFVMSVDYVFDNVFKDRHRNRINELLGIISDPTGTGYNQHQSKIAIGSGGFSGKGFLQGTQTKFDFVPEQSTDFIFCTVGEEWGFIGSFLVIFLFVFLLVRIIFIAERQRSKFSRIYGYSVASILFFHFTINVAMTIGLAPVIGIPLPFFSYGGSSLWGFTILLFIFIKLDSERKYVLH